MQTIIVAHCSPGQSLRELIAKDSRLERHALEVVREQQAGRSPGWLKLRSTNRERRGAINVRWDRHAVLLQCRIVSRGGGRPNLVLGDFLDYLIARFPRRIRFITISIRDGGR